MSIVGLSLNERDPVKQNHAIRQLMEGRNNASGIVSLTASTTTTSVSAPNCSVSSSIILFPASHAAATELASGNLYVSSGTVQNGGFTINHTNTTSARLFYWTALG